MGMTTLATLDPAMNNAVDLCAGIGGWAIALRERGLLDLPVENNTHARAALEANGLRPFHDDVTTLLALLTFEQRLAILAVCGSTPCQGFSQANTGAKGLDDPRAALIHVWLEIVLAIRPAFACLENVPRQTGWIFDELVEALEAVGYAAEQRVVCAADYGDAQARKRRILVARRDGAAVKWPDPTHRDTRTGKDDGRLPWRTLADLLPDRTDLPAWAHAHPSTTIVGSFKPECLAPPTYRKPGDGPRQSQPDVVVATLEERLAVQGFPAGWHTAGPVTARGLQVGNAIPPTLARVALAAATDGTLR